MSDAFGLSFLDTRVEDLAMPHEAGVAPRLGAAVVRVPLAFSSGRAGFGPRFALEYDSSAGNSPFGFGWSLTGLLGISLDTRQSLPKYDGTDRYAFTGAGGELVPALERQGDQWMPRVDDRGAFWVRHYRGRVETEHLRLEQWIEKTSGREHWQSRDVGNVVTVYGRDQGRVADPVAGHRTFAWLPEAQYDPHGNAIIYEYATENLAGVDVSESFEWECRGELAQRYLKRIRYGNSRPLGLDTALPADLEWAFEVVLDYGDHAGPLTPAPTPDRSWLPRRDAYSTWRPGFEVRTYRLCRRLLCFHRFAALGPDPVLVAAYRLDFDERAEHSVLTAIANIGSRRDPMSGESSRRSLPPIRFTYSLPIVAGAFEPVPDEAEVNVPGGLGNAYRWVDLHGEGLPGILAETSQAWYYKSNQGDGRFGAQQIVAERPSYRLGQCALVDFDGDGNTDLVAFHGREAGFYELDRDTERWVSFQPLAALPHVEAAGRKAQWVDLNGDGRPDLVVADPQRLTWYPSTGKDGFDAPVEIQRPGGLPAVAAMGDDRSLDFFLADMNGDGLVDQVRVRNGRVEYWPHAGHGRFADPILMEGSPVFAPDHEFDSSRVFLIDLDGNGMADLLYVGRGDARFWINATGNRLVEGGRLAGLPYIDNVSSLRVLDFLGNGTPCLVWSTPLEDSRGSMHYLPLTSGVKPGLLLSIDNSMGREVRLEYGTSARHYLRDKAAGRPWSTRLPSHTTVVESKEVIDHIGGSRSHSRYIYHDGYFDGNERAFRGFAMVDQFDTEVHDGLATAPEIAYTTPSLVRTWYHVGRSEADHFRDRYDDPLRAPLRALTVEYPDELSADEADDATRAPQGVVLRQEVFAASAGGRRGAHPIQIVQHAYRVRRLQPSRGRSPASFTHYLAERLVDDYEQQPSDPRSSHRLTLEVDDFGLTRCACDVGYPRRGDLVPDTPAQQQLLVTATTHRFVHVDGVDQYQIGIPIEEQQFELAGLTPGEGRLLSWTALRATVAAAIVEPRPFHERLAGHSPEARLISWKRCFYWNTDRTAARLLGDLGSLPLLHHEEIACLTPEFVATTYGPRVDANLLEGESGYRLEGGYWWSRGPTLNFADATSFFLLLSTERPDGGLTRVSYDPALVALTAVEDSFGNRTEARIDYHLLAADRITDPNGAVAEVIYDPLGIVVVSTHQAQVLDDTGVARTHGQDRLSRYTVRPDQTFVGILADPASFLQNAAAFVYYELESWSTFRTPPRAIQLVREELRHDGRGGGDLEGNAQVSVSYFDGLRRVLQSKTRVEPGPALLRDNDGSLQLDDAGRPVEGPAPVRWLVSGHTVFNRKQQPVRQYEPFYSTLAAFESEEALSTFGVFQQLQYDAAGRVVRQDAPNGTFTRTEYRSWRVERFDPNDTVIGSLYRVMRENLPPDDLENDALRKAEAHAETPLLTHLDPLGRDISQVETGLGENRVTATSLDVRGTPIAIVDPRGITAVSSTSDMLGRTCVMASVDAGQRWTLFDIYDCPIHVWNGRGVHEHRTFDRLDRPTSVFVDDALGLNHMTERLVYGEDPGIAAAASRNLRGRLAEHFDQAGITRVLQYDGTGNVLRCERELREEYKGEPDWTNPDLVALEPDRYLTSSLFDGLGRLRQQSLPDGTTRRLDYVTSGGLARATLSSSDGKVADLTLLDGTTFNARGQRTRAALGNGVELAHEFDRETFRTTRIVASRPPASPGGEAATLQDLRYVYDPAGNVTYACDESQQPAVAGPFLQGLNVAPDTDYTYDPFYQLVRATGRVHQALLEHDYRPNLADPGFLKGTRHLTLNNGAAVERWTRTYAYDIGGNLSRMVHSGTSRSWTTDFWISATSNRSLPALNPSGDPVLAPESRFDAAGNCTALPHLRRLEWTYRNSLARAVVIDRAAAGRPDDAEYYQYDGQGSRIRKVTERVVDGGLETIEILYFDGCEIKRVTSGGAVVLERATSHVADDFNRIAIVDRWSRDDLARETDNVDRARVRYQLANHLGSARFELDEDGAVVSYEEYFPFGATAFIAGDDLREVARRDYRFSGKENDAATGLYYFGYRYYAPWMGRWMSPDPIGPEDDLNLYVYVRNNPINLIDPDGLDSSVPSGSVTYVPGELTGRFRTAYLNLSKEERAAYDRGELALMATRGGIRAVAPEVLAAEAMSRARAGSHVTVAREGPAPPPPPGPPPEPIMVTNIEMEPEWVNAGPDVIVVGPGEEPGGNPALITRPDTSAAAGAHESSGGEPGADGRARGAGGGGAGDRGTSSSRDEHATGTHKADGSSTEATAAGEMGGGSGLGTGLSGSRRGGGGTALLRVPGVGNGGTRGSGTRIGSRTGGGATGNGSDGRGGAGGGDVDGGAGIPGGEPGGTGSAVLSDEERHRSGSTGVEDLETTGNLPASPGTGLPARPGTTLNGDDPDGSRRGRLTGTPGESGEPRGGAGANPTTSSGEGHGESSPPPGVPTAETGESGGGGLGPVDETLGDKIVHYLGYLNLEFGDPDPNGVSGGVPGGSGTNNLGWFGQTLYGLLTIASLLLILFGGGEIKAGFAALRSSLRAAFTSLANLFTRAFWAGARARLRTWLVNRGVRVLLREARGYIATGLTRAKAAYLIRPYTGMFHHFLPRRWAWLPRAVVDSSLNLMGRGLSRGAFYARHFLGDPHFWGARFPKSIGGGSWRGLAMGLAKPGYPLYWWYGAPNWLRVAAVGTGSAGVGAAGYFIATDDDE